MDFLDNYNKLIKDVGIDFEDKKIVHRISKDALLFPFKIDTTRPFFENGFYNIFGEFSRILLNKRIKNDFLVNNIIQNLIDKNDTILIDEEDDKKYLTKLLKEYLFNEKNELKLIHPSLYLYVPLSNSKQSSGEKDLALFLRDIFCLDNPDLINFFKSNESTNIIMNLILDNIPSYLDNNQIKPKYFSKLEYVNNIFNEDINFAIKNKKFFLNNMDNIFAYYYFFYISQLILKISKRLEYDSSVEELYYLLDWEKISKNRETRTKGYEFLKNECDATYPRINLISHLNTLLGTKYYLEDELLNYFQDLSYEDQQNFLDILKKWIKDYRYISDLEEIDLPSNYEQLVDILLDSLKKGVSYKSINLFTLNLDEIGKKYFLKRRGIYRYVLNINRDMLLMITALCVKDKKIKLNKLFKEYEKRGIFFDRDSREEVINFLTKLNLIDKKSDSGDAQYVKPVL